MPFGLKRLGCAAAVLAIVAACDAPIPAGPVPQDQVVSGAQPGGAIIAGQLIAFASTRGREADFIFQTYVMKANGTKVTQLTDQLFYNARPDWSHDGAKITITSCRLGDDGCEIYVMNANGSAQTNVTHNFATDVESVWSPDDKKIAFSSDRDGNSEIYVMNADGSNPVRLTFDNAVDEQPSWSPDGKKDAVQRGRRGKPQSLLNDPRGLSAAQSYPHP